MPAYVMEELRAAQIRIRAILTQRIGRPDVLVFDASHDWSTPVRGPERTMVFADSQGTRKTEGSRLLVAAHCGDSTAWPDIDAAFESEGFETYGPVSVLGDQCYQSTRRAWFVVPEHPDSEMAVDRTGRAVLGWIATH
jgi:hypothetical protein